MEFSLSAASATLQNADMDKQAILPLGPGLDLRIGPDGKLYAKHGHLARLHLLDQAQLRRWVMRQLKEALK